MKESIPLAEKNLRHLLKMLAFQLVLKKTELSKFGIHRRIGTIKAENSVNVLGWLGI